MYGRVDLVLVRYNDPITYGVHYTTPEGQTATLCPPDKLDEHFKLGEEIDITVDDIWFQIPIEWKTGDITDKWILNRVTAYDKITRIKD